MNRILPVLLLLVSSGCAVRTLTIDSRPQGARIILNHSEIGVTPLKAKFTHYGDHDLILLKQGWQPYHGRLTLKPPGWAVFPLDLVTEALLPLKLRDDREVVVELEKPPLEIPPGTSP
ncbi:MAG: PEGA domain-containing protein [Planctomycetes bacterium]|nr:PEGA domain-containing protein [Planctomycetota bacterium]